MFKRLEEKLLEKLIYRKLNTKLQHHVMQRDIIRYALMHDIDFFPEDSLNTHKATWMNAVKREVEFMK